jgi:hypothetical protein
MSENPDVKPTIVLVHGAYADASSWNGVIERLQQQGYTVIAAANPLRGVTSDSAYIASLLGQIDGPVLLAGRADGGGVRDQPRADPGGLRRRPAPETTALMAATQRPAAAAAFTDASGPPAWKKLPSWAVVATGDKAARTDVVRAQAQRAGADIIEVEGSHVIKISQPQVVTDHILKAARAIAASPR